MSVVDHNQTSKIELQTILLIDDDDRFLDIRDSVTGFDISYDLFGKSISAVFKITDYKSLLSDFQINGNENIVIVFKTPSLTLGKYDKFKDKLSFIFRVIGIKDRKIKSARATEYLLQGISIESVNNNRLSIQKTYSDLDGSEIIKDIYDKFLKPKTEEYGDIGSSLYEKDLNFTKTGNRPYIVFDNEKPFDAIRKVCVYSEYTEKNTAPIKNAAGNKKNKSQSLSDTVKEEVQKTESTQVQLKSVTNKLKENLKQKKNFLKSKNLSGLKEIEKNNKELLDDLKENMEKIGRSSSSTLRDVQNQFVKNFNELAEVVNDSFKSGNLQENIKQNLNLVKSKFNKLSIGRDFTTSNEFSDISKKIDTMYTIFKNGDVNSNNLKNIQIDISSIMNDIDLSNVNNVESNLQNISGQLNKFVQGSLFTDLQKQIQTKLNFKSIFNSSKADDIVKSLRVKSLLGGNPIEKLGLESVFDQLGLDKAFQSFSSNLDFDINDIVKESGFDDLTDLLNSKGSSELLDTFKNKFISSVSKFQNTGVNLETLVNENLNKVQTQLGNIKSTGLLSETLNDIETDLTNLNSKIVNVFDDPKIQNGISDAIRELPSVADNLTDLSSAAIDSIAAETTFGLNTATNFLNSAEAKTELTGVLDNLSVSMDSSLIQFNDFSKDLNKNVTSQIGQLKIKNLSSQLGSSMKEFSSIVNNVKADTKLPDITKLTKKLEFNINKLSKQINVEELTGELKENLIDVTQNMKFTINTLKENFDSGTFDSLKTQMSDISSSFKQKFAGSGIIVSKASLFEDKLNSLNKVVGELTTSTNIDIFKTEISSLEKAFSNLGDTVSSEIPIDLDDLIKNTNTLMNDSSNSLLGEVGNLTDQLKSSIDDFSLNLEPSELAQKIGLNLNKLGKFDKDNLNLEEIKNITGINLMEFAGGSLAVAEGLVDKLKKGINTSKLTRGSVGTSSSVVSPNITPLQKERSSKEVTEKSYMKEIQEIPSKKTKSSNFVFYENNKGWNFVTLDQLMLADKKIFKEGGKVQEFFFFDRSSIDEISKDVDGSPIHEHQKIKEFKYVRQLDNIENLNKGLFNYTTLSFDPITKIRIVSNFNYERDMKQIAHIDSTEFASVITPSSVYNKQKTKNTLTRSGEGPTRELIFSNIGNSYSDPMFISKSLFDPQLRNPATWHKWKHLDYVSRVQFNNIVLEIEVTGNTDLEIGQLIKINIPNDSFDKEKIIEFDRLFGDVNKGAFFIISKLKHSFYTENGIFSTTVQCVKDTNHTTLAKR